ncbi:uncharacterized protein LOC113780452 [Coffea eugenioides]|uniref:uncharacterized protein LOC113780452 n=1 Tax=Coffea eugenioides TaxID=49369 RepID=UPI000F613AAB|nr:uncharacterized protein LOC113780452 [Coffea eugenioides]
MSEAQHSPQECPSPILVPLQALVAEQEGEGSGMGNRFEVLSTLGNHKISLVFLLELMSEVKQLDTVRRRLKLDHGTSFLNGKVWCLWSGTFKISFQESAEQVVHGRLTFQSGETISISAVYAKCTRVGRRPLWSCLEDFSMGRSEPWIIAGDFNMIASSEEQRGGVQLMALTWTSSIHPCLRAGSPRLTLMGVPLPGTVWQRLDRALINAWWVAEYPVTRVSHLPRGRSDHSPLLIKTGSAASVRPSFRYLNIWHRHPTFRETVSTVWQGSGSGVGMHLFHSKLSSLRTQLRKWNKEKFKNIFAQVQSAEDTYKQREAKFDSRGDVSSKTRLHEARAMYLREFGFVPPPTLPLELLRVAAEEDAGLRHLPDLEEIQTVVFSMDASSAPGSDGFGAGFYQQCWEIIKDDLLGVVQDFFKGMQQPGSFSSALLVLIPKTEGACQWKDFRPISLCNTSSKIISKILANRLGGLLPKPILPWQTGFVPGRGIMDNILLAQELVMELDRKLAHLNLVLKLDMEKAYDRVEWPFLLFMLRSFGFSEVTVVAGNSGGNSGIINPSLRPSILEFLGQGLQQLGLNHKDRRFVSAGATVPYLAFADDIIIFTWCSKPSLIALHEFLFLYQKHSGQKVNAGKSTLLTPARMSEDHIRLVETTLGFHRQSFPVKYLGVPLVRGRMGTIVFDPLLAKLRARLFHWSSKLLSTGGKIVLIRHVLGSIPLYLLQAICPPKTVVTALGRICNSFLWNSNVDSKRMHWATWEKLCFPVQERGLGFRSFFESAKAFACKSWGQLRRNDSIWAEYMHSKYIKDSHPSIVVVDHPPASWRRLLAVRDFAETRIRWCLGKGLVDFWYDTWCGDLPLALVVGVTNPPHALVAEFYIAHGWNVPRLKEWVPDFVVQRILSSLNRTMPWFGYHHTTVISLWLPHGRTSFKDVIHRGLIAIYGG